MCFLESSRMSFSSQRNVALCDISHLSHHTSPILNQKIRQSQIPVIKV